MLAPRSPAPPAAPPVRVALPLPPTPKPETKPATVPDPLPPTAANPVPAIAPTTPPATLPPIPAWQRHAIATPPTHGRPVIAIVIDDLGLDRRRSARTVSLPGPLTLAWLPYAADVTRQAAAARAAGHELLLHAPMQPQGRENPGPNALTTDLSSEEIRRRVSGYMALLPEAVGLNNHMGSHFTRNADAMAPVIGELKSRGLLFLDSRTALDSVAASVARAADLPHAIRDVFLDNEQSSDYVNARLAETEAVARRRGSAIAIGHPHDATLNALEGWLASLSSRGFALVPLTEIVRRRAGAVVTAGSPPS
jgi:polysaccharide deacetylase 2 family uncharacterized protein YibQ